MDYATMLANFTASVGAIDSVNKLVKSVRDTIKGDKIAEVDVTELRARLSELFDVALTARQMQFEMQDAFRALQHENEGLRKQIVEMSTFDASAGDYELRAVSRNSFAYLKRGAPEVAGKTQYLCMPCFDSRKKATLQLDRTEFNQDTLVCPTCGTKVFVPNGVTADVYLGEVNRHWSLDDI